MIQKTWEVTRDPVHRGLPSLVSLPFSEIEVMAWDSLPDPLWLPIDFQTQTV